MIHIRTIPVLVFLLLATVAGAQINIYLGGNLQGNYSWMREDGHTFKPGFGGGFSLAYWEYEYWFLKTGLEYHYMSSAALRYPEDFGVEPADPQDKINIGFNEQTIGVPLALYFRPYESGENTFLIVGKLEPSFVIHLKESSDEYGDLVLKGTDVKTRVKTNLGLGAGYQRQLDRYMYLNIYPSFNMDLRGQQVFNSVTLTVELLYGVY